jgi:hypothetical protein
MTHRKAHIGLGIVTVTITQADGTTTRSTSLPADTPPQTPPKDSPDGEHRPHQL